MEKNEAPATKKELFENQTAPCAICGRPLGLVNVDRHHLVPKTHGGKQQYFLHKICHRKIHSVFTEKELEKVYHTWDLLKNHPEMIAFIAWVSKKPTDFYSGSKETSVRKGKR